MDGARNIPRAIYTLSKPKHVMIQIIMNGYFLRFIMFYTVFHLMVIRRFTQGPPRPDVTIIEKINIRGEEIRTISLDPVNKVDMFYGVGVMSASTNSRGNIFPVVSAGPHAYNHWTFTTNGNSPWMFQRGSHKFAGIRCTHQPSPWIGDYGFFDIGLTNMNTWDQSETYLSPSYLDISDGTMTMSLAPTDTGAALRIINNSGKRVKLKIKGAEATGPFTIKLTTIKTSVFKAPSHTKFYVVINTDKPIGKDMSFDHTEMNLMIGTSFIDSNQAEVNMPFMSFDEQRGVNDETWNHWLSKVLVRDVYDMSDDMTMLYTMLHRALLFPRVMSELHFGRMQHYSPYASSYELFEGQISTDSGFWDAYRTVYPFLHLVYPSLAKKVLDGWVNAIKEDPSGLLPQWASPGKVDSMEGTMGEVSIAEGIVNGAITDVDTAWNYLYKSAFVAGRTHFDEYRMLGYVPGEVSLSLNYYLADYVVSLAATHLGYHDLATKLEERSGGWRLLFDQETNFFRSKGRDDKFTPGFDQYRWMGPYREGGPWQYRFYVPHDPQGLNGIAGYKGTMCKYLNGMMNHKNTVSNPHKIHEETEMQQHSYGQYAHNNQVVHHVLYMFAHVGCAFDGQELINLMIKEQYTKAGYSGDEDNGEMSAWYILSQLGLYSLVPGSGEYQIGSPPPWREVILKERDIIIRNKKRRKTWSNVDIDTENYHVDDIPKIKLGNKILINF